SPDLHGLRDLKRMFFLTFLIPVGLGNSIKLTESDLFSFLERGRILPSLRNTIEQEGDLNCPASKKRGKCMTQNPEESPIHGEVTHLNPETLHKNPAFTQVITVTGPARTIYIGGQDAVDAAGNIVGKGDLVAQTHQVLLNLRTALAEASARPEHIIKWNVYLVQGQSLQAGVTAFQQFWGD